MERVPACRRLPISAVLSLALIPIGGRLAAQAPETSALAWRNIGPANMMGRISAVEAHPRDHRFVVVASASGGVFLSENAGVTWRAIFDDYGACSIGAVAFHPENRDVIWVGTGEASNRNSVGWGNGVWKSTDRGRSFTCVGLEDTLQIAEIALHPTDHDVAYVAAVGSLWGPSGSRGLYRTRDGGASWERLGDGLPEAIGCTEVLVHPDDPQHVFCGMYHRVRQPWSMQSGGQGGGLFQSRDGGDTWARLTEGLPTGDTGMIDVAVCLGTPDVMVANIEADESLPEDLSVPGPGVYVSRDRGQTWSYKLRHHTRPFYHGQIDVDPNDPDRIFVVSRDFRVSTDGGETWRGRWWGGGGDDHDFWISPADSRVWYMATDQGCYHTVDDGRTVVGFDNMAIGQYYAIAVGRDDPYHVMGGLQDNALWYGPSNSREPRGILNMHNTWVGEGDGFHCAIDPRDHRTLYLVNHVGFAARLDVVTREHAYITPTPETVSNLADWFDPDHPDEPVRYTIEPGEGWFFARHPQRPRMPPQFRFNWSSPLALSPHDPDTVYFAGNHLFESRDRGDSWRIVSPDLTTNDIDKRRPSEQGGLTRNVTGGENHCTIVTMAVSPLEARELWAGSDDGRVHVSRDGGGSWQDVSAGIFGGAERPRGAAWISRVEPSHFVRGRCYAAVDDHRRDDRRPWIFVTEDHGATWQPCAGGLPADGSVYVVREDLRNPDLLFCGTEFGCFCSLDRGANWSPLGRGLPHGVAVHDLVIQPDCMDLVAGTHGRSIWIQDDVTPLQQWSEREPGLHLFRPRRATTWRTIRLGRKQPSFLFRGENPPPGATLHYALDGEAVDVEVRVSSLDGERVWKRSLSERGAGLHRVLWPLRFDPDGRALKRRLLGALAILEVELADRPEREGLAEIRRRLEGAESVRALNAVRGQLVRDYGAWALGRPLFGARLEPVVAAPGTYRVTVEATVAGERVVRATELVVRDDPLAGGRR